MRHALLLRGFLLGAFAVLFTVLWIRRTVPQVSGPKGYSLLKLDAVSASSQLFAEITKLGLQPITAESLKEIPEPQNKNYFTKKYFTDSESYTAWFFDAAGFQNCYFKKPHPVQRLKLYLLLEKNTKQFFLYDYRVISWVGIAVLLFFVLLLVKTSNKILFTALSVPAVALSFFAQSMLLTLALLMQLYAAFFWLGVFRLQAQNAAARLVQNKMLVFISVAAVIMPFFTDQRIPYCITLALAGVLFFLLRDIRSLWQQYSEYKTNHKILKFYGLSQKNNFLSNENVKPITCLFISALCISFMLSWLRGSKLDTKVKKLSVPVMEHICPDFSTESFFENAAMITFIPNLTNYVRDRWFDSALQYTKVSEVPILERNAKVYYNTVVFLSGKMTETENIVLEFTDDFVQKTMAEAVAYPLYRMMAEQEGFACFRLKDIQPAHESAAQKVLCFFIPLICFTVLFSAAKNDTVTNKRDTIERSNKV